jgi:hypothetical protein
LRRRLAAIGAVRCDHFDPVPAQFLVERIAVVSETSNQVLLPVLSCPETMPNRFETDPAAYEQLLAKVLLGDNGARRILVSLLAPVIRRVANRYAADLREDLIQDVWAHLWSHNGHTWVRLEASREKNMR